MSQRIHIERAIDNEAQVYGHYIMTLRNKHGNIIKRGEYEVHSIIEQYWLFIYNTLRSSSTGSYRRVDNSGNTSITHLATRSGNGGTLDSRGICVGTSSAAVAFTNNSLGGFIASGTATGQLLYSDAIVGYDASTGKATITQTFTNNTALDIDVNEVGIAVSQSAVDGTQAMFIRDVPGSTFAVLPAAVLTVSYEIQFPFGCQNWHMMFAKHQIARNTANISLYNVTGTLVTSGSFGTADGAFGFTAIIGNDKRGIIVGNSSNLETINTFALGTQISHGEGAGQLMHYDSTISSYETSTTPNVSAFYISRVFINRSGASVNIAEVGIASNATIGLTNFTYLFDRRVLGSEISVADNQSVTITFAYKYTFS